MGISTLASWPLVIWKTLEFEGHDPRPVFRAAGLDPALLGNPRARYDSNKLDRCFAEAAKVSGCHCFGVEAARHWHPMMLQALSLAWFASTTLYDAFGRLVRNMKMVNTGLRGELVHQGKSYRFVVHLAEPEASYHVERAHSALASIVAMCRQSLSHRFHPMSVQLAEIEGPCHPDLTDFFHCPIEYGAANYGFTLAEADLHKRLPLGNLETLTAADRALAEYLSTLDRDDIVARARSVIFKMLPTGNVSEEAVAKALHMSRRTFQRKLEEAGTGYRKMFDRVRRELAETYIADDRYSITEISYLLGFAEPSSFARKYKDWTGVPPSAKRQSVN
jgi:AraC-like DNA-binding protein